MKKTRQKLWNFGYTDHAIIGNGNHVNLLNSVLKIRETTSSKSLTSFSHLEPLCIVEWCRTMYLHAL